MKIFLRIILPLSLVLVVFSGCAPPNAELVREIGSKKQFIFEAEENYRIVYEKILSQANKCFHTSKLTAQMVAKGELQEEKTFGTVTVEFHGILAVDTYQIIDVYAIDDNRTVVIAYYSLGQVDKYGQALKQWVLENSTDCGL